MSAESRYTQQKCHHRRASHQAARVSRGVCSGMLSAQGNAGYDARNPGCMRPCTPSHREAWARCSGTMFIGRTPAGPYVCDLASCGSKRGSRYGHSLPRGCNPVTAPTGEGVGSDAVRSGAVSFMDGAGEGQEGSS